MRALRFQKVMQRCLKSKQNSCGLYVWEFIFSTHIDLHLASLPKSVTHLSQVFYEEIA